MTSLAASAHPSVAIRCRPNSGASFGFDRATRVYIAIGPIFR